MKVIQSYQQGAKHISKNQPCEDRTFHLTKNGVETIALADGAGSQKYTHSANGAECVTETICKFFCNNFDKFYEKANIDELRTTIMAVCQKKLSELAEKLSVDSIVRLSSTLLAVAIKDDKVIVCHIGDGVIGKLTPIGTVVVSAPDNGEFAGTTYFITNSRADEHINIIKENIDDTLAYFLMSDGTSDYIYDENNEKFHDAARKMALMSISKNGQKKLDETIKEYMIEKDSSSDDCSFICISLNNGFEDEDDLISEENVKTIVNDDFDKNNKNDENSNAKSKDEIENIIESFNKTNDEIKIEKSSKKQKQNKKKNSSKNTIPIIISILLVVAFAFAIAVTVFIIGNDKGNDKSSEKQNTTTVEYMSESTKNDTKSRENTEEMHSDNREKESNLTNQENQIEKTTDKINTDSEYTSEVTTDKETSGSTQILKSIKFGGKNNG